MLNKLKVLVSAVGAPGCSTLIRKIRENGEREIFIVGVDSDEEVFGNFYSDTFYKVPTVDKKEEYINKIIEIIKKEKPDVFYPVSSAEVPIISEIKNEIELLGTKVCVSSNESILLSENKYELYKLLDDNGIPVPKFYYPKNLEEFNKFAKELGYPQKQICFKPHVSKGSRGFRIIDDTISRKDLLLNYKPEARYMSMKEFNEIFENEEEFPDLLLMEVAQGNDLDVMALCDNGENFITTIKTREKSRWGIITLGELVDDMDIRTYTDKIVELTGLSFNIGIQFIGNKVIEINPRPSTFIYHETINEPYLAIKYRLGEITKEELKKVESNIKFGVRMIRYMDQIFYEDIKNRKYYN